MSTQVGERVEVGQCDLGYVFIYHAASKGDYTDRPERETWKVRAGNHTVGTYGTEAEADAVARALVGEQRISNEYAAEHPVMATTPRPNQDAGESAYVADTRAKVAKK